ncbi:hypothetical protein H072_5853 [Dactylellina haptotyla CBS 200.50]|uniref:Uncharacterized protein n=1 Tax=Dactylellina haptotyla (strain CBS 200.50) TaxID=1284197 RepID=S8ABS1_DACHA|nr:hypothetical protein H072_5853 [Dactylellina haptotyla CBS 200.50]
MFGGSTFSPDKDVPDLSDKVIIVTGGNIGLGLETVRQLVKHNPARVYLAARSKEKADAAIEKLRASNPNAAPISFLSLDLASFESIKAAVQAFQSVESRLDVLVNNAGIMMSPEGLTKEGYEIQFGTNHLGHALLIHLLLPILQRTAVINPEARVVTVSSGLEASAPDDIYQLNELKTTMPKRTATARYAISKVANIHYTLALAERYKTVKFIVIHPGVVQSNLRHDVSGVFLRAFMTTAVDFLATPVEKGVLTQLWAAVSLEAKSGECYRPTAAIWKPSKPSRNHKLQEQLWNWTQEQFENQS